MQSNYLDRIRNRFNNASYSYDEVASVQKESASILVDIINKYIQYQPNSIIDIGTGTGYVPEMLLSNFSSSEYHLNDISENMLNIAREKLLNKSNINLILGDIENIKLNQEYDLITSNFSLQWMSDLHRLIRYLYSKSKIFAFSCLLDDTFKEWDRLLNEYSIFPKRQYPSYELINNILREINSKSIYLHKKDFTIRFKDPINVIYYLKKLGATAISSEVDLSNIFKMIKLHKESCILNYSVLFIFLERR